jgi:hypothetical protein
MGTIPQWISASGIAALVYVFFWRQVSLKKVDVEAQQVQVNAVTAHHADEADIRDHYAREVHDLRELARTMSADHEECKRERDEFRREVARLDGKLVGITRQFIHYQQVTKGVIPPEMQAALEEIGHIAINGNGK